MEPKSKVRGYAIHKKMVFLEVHYYTTVIKYYIIKIF